MAGLGVALAQTATTGIDVSRVTSAFGNLDTAISTVGGLIIAAAALAVTFSFNNQNFAIDLTPMCNLMTDIRYLVLAACALIAAFIVSGSARSTGGGSAP